MVAPVRSTHGVDVGGDVVLPAQPEFAGHLVGERDPIDPTVARTHRASGGRDRRGRGAELAVAGVAEAGHDEGLFVEALVDRGGVEVDRQPGVARSAWMPSGAASAHTTMIGSGAPRSSSSSIVAISEPPVASIGSSTITAGRPATRAAC